jgi:hypothetical protein
MPASSQSQCVKLRRSRQVVARGLAPPGTAGATRQKPMGMQRRPQPVLRNRHLLLFTWMTVGSVNPMPSTAATSGGERPRFANVSGGSAGRLPASPALRSGRETCTTVSSGAREVRHDDSCRKSWLEVGTAGAPRRLQQKPAALVPTVGTHTGDHPAGRPARDTAEATMLRLRGAAVGAEAESVERPHMAIAQRAAASARLRRTAVSVCPPATCSPSVYDLRRKLHRTERMQHWV